MTVKIGMVGLGHMGQLHMLNAMRVDGVKVVAAADKDKKSRAYAERFHVRTYDDYTKLIDSEELDAVIVSLPNFLKKDGVFYASERGLDVFLDKPFSRGFAEAEAIMNKAQHNGTRLMVGVNYRYFPCVQKLKAKLDSGQLGDTVIATSELVLNGPISHGAVPVPVPEWWLNKDLAGGGALLDLGYHLVDLLTWMLGDFTVSFSQLGHKMNLPVEDAGTVVLHSKDCDLDCIVNVGWFSKSIFPDFNFRLNLHGTVGFDSTDRYIPADAKMNAFKEGVKNIARRITFQKPNYLSYTYYYESFYTIMRLFFDSLKNGSEFPVSLPQQLDVVRIIESAYKQNGVQKNGESNSNFC